MFMEKFMLIFHGGLNHDASASEMQENMGKWLAWVDKLKKENRYLGGEPLLPGGKLLTGKKTVTDGPYTEGKEVVGGFFIIHARDYDDAIRICDDFPDYELGGKVQVRQVMNIPM